jgi:glycosyltransferase involved in cell wall biosynthesis
VRVLIVAEQLRRPVPGGIGTYTRGLLQGLAQLPDLDVEAALHFSRGPVPDGLPAGIEVVASPLPGQVLTRGWDFGLIGAPDGYDVVHAVSLAAPPSSSPLSITVHDVAWRTVPEAFPRRGRRWHERALRRALKRAQLLIAPSRETAKAIRDRRVHVIEEGCDHLPPPDVDGAAALLDRLGVVGPYVLTVSTLEPRKNLPRLIDAHRRAALRMPLVVVGPPGWGPALTPPAGVHLTGFVDEPTKAALLRNARCVAYVPLLEGFGLPAVEAMAMGAPVVASPMPSIGRPAAALVVDPADTNAIAAALTEAATDEAVRDRLIEAGAKRAAQLTWANAAAQHVDAWSQLL